MSEDLEVLHVEFEKLELFALAGIITVNWLADIITSIDRLLTRC